MANTPQSRSGSGGDTSRSESSRSSRPTSDRSASEGALVEHLMNVAPESEDAEIRETLKRLLVVLAIAVLGVVAISRYRTSRNESQGKISERFSLVQESYGDLQTKFSGDELSEEETADAQKLLVAIKDNSDLLTNENPTSFYAMVSPLYVALAEYQVGDPEVADKILDQFNADLTSSGVTDPSKRVGAELAMLKLARMSLDSGKVDVAEPMLKELLSNGEIARIEALESLWSLKKSPAEKEQLLGEIKNLVADLPDLDEQIKSIISEEYYEKIEIEGES